MDRFPAAMFSIMVGMNSGFTRFAPFSCRVMQPFSSSSRPPIPLPHTHAMRQASPSSAQRPLWAMASSAATMAYWTNGANLRASFLENPHATGSKSGISAATLPAKPLASNFVTLPMQQRPSLTALHKGITPMPAGDTDPMPVMTTRCVPSLLRISFVLIAKYLRLRL